MRRNFGYGLTLLRGMGAPPVGYVPNSVAAADYLARYSDLDSHGTTNDAWQHYVTYGEREGRRWDFTKGVTVVTPAPVVTVTPAPAAAGTLFGIPSSYLLIGAAAIFFLSRK